MEYKPSFLFRNGYISTIYPTYFRKVEGVNYRREKIDTFDDDFLLLDWSEVSDNKDYLAIISHGLEGKSDRAYVRGMAKAFNSIGVNALAWNFRGCGGEPNKKPQMYHSCKIEDLECVIKHAIEKGYKNIVLVGFSMGGNLSLYYAGKMGDKILPQVKGVIAFSVPLDIRDVSETLAKPRNKIFMKRFLKMLREKIEVKSKMFPKIVSIEGYEKIKDFKDFDDRYTAPLHGFKNAYHYWETCSSKQYLENIKIPTLIVNAQNDPFLGDKCYPEEVKNKNITLLYPKYGGHVGFVLKRKDGLYWSELTAIDFFKEKIRK
ncbi:conserved hypothetical protein [Thermotomaculum hydrothermale]|uniref:AB hydrolase-1 domain-containing protein n=1 Tax=Thermotomaculum hydrothermale TaxID=981385 RepID=A0A7R6PQR6_9BACT|nr:alpha/beta fold hydrolase [Thermotomaculum hydrothermale]BBB33606.1 conserved hypothetical protein [Thermotomaculum hydrothermale]